MRRAAACTEACTAACSSARGVGRRPAVQATRARDWGCMAWCLVAPGVLRACRGFFRSSGVDGRACHDAGENVRRPLAQDVVRRQSCGALDRCAPSLVCGGGLHEPVAAGGDSAETRAFDESTATENEAARWYAVRPGIWTRCHPVAERDVLDSETRPPAPGVITSRWREVPGRTRSDSAFTSGGHGPGTSCRVVGESGRGAVGRRTDASKSGDAVAGGRPVCDRIRARGDGRRSRRGAGGDLVS